jgi:hypothetical protein
VSWPSRNSAATTTLLPRRACACARSGGNIAIGNISAVGMGADGVADGVEDDIVIAVLVSREDNNLVGNSLKRGCEVSARYIPLCQRQG